jgi:hypothetical protein
MIDLILQWQNEEKIKNKKKLNMVKRAWLLNSLWSEEDYYYVYP